MSKRFLALMLALTLVAGSMFGLAGCAEKTEEGGETGTEASVDQTESVRDQYLMTVDDLAAGIADYVVIDARAADAYDAGHIPGAINAPWQTFAAMDGAPGDAEWGTLLPAAEIAAKLGSLGVDTKRTIVVYADPTGRGEDGRVAWTLLSAGVTNVRMLDGGWPMWSGSGKAVSTEPVKLAATTVTAAAELDGDLNVTTEYLNDKLSMLQIVDSRAAKEYEGATDFGEKRGGHIPGAVNVAYADLFNDDGTVKSDADLRAMFEAAGLDSNAETVFYCTKGIRSGLMALLARMVGFESAKNYDASIYTWAGNPELPME